MCYRSHPIDPPSLLQYCGWSHPTTQQVGNFFLKKSCPPYAFSTQSLSSFQFFLVETTWNYRSISWMMFFSSFHLSLAFFCMLLTCEFNIWGSQLVLLKIQFATKMFSQCQHWVILFSIGQLLLLNAVVAIHLTFFWTLIVICVVHFLLCSASRSHTVRWLDGSPAYFLCCLLCCIYDASHRILTFPCNELATPVYITTYH